MTLGELIAALPNTSADQEVVRLTRMLEEWKSGPENAAALRESVERFIGYSWIASDAEHAAVYQLWSKFRDECIAGGAAMSMNERLAAFDLVDRYEHCRSHAERASVLRKVHLPAEGHAHANAEQ